MLGVVLIATLSAYFVSGLRIEQDNESMQSNQARHDPVYTQFKNAFGAEFELMLTITRKNIGSESGRPQLQHDIEWLRGLAGVQQVYFPLHPDKASGFVSADRQTVGLLLTLSSEQSRADRLHLLEQLRVDAPDRIDGVVQVVGLPLVKERVAHHIAHDQAVVIPLSLLVMGLMLAALFRRVAGVVLPMVVVAMSLISTLGIYAACGLELNSITSLLPPVVIVLSVSVAVHLFDAWNHEIRSGICGEAAIQKALRAVWKPCVFTAAMTAAGLLSLYISPIPAVRLFGLFSAVGVSLSVCFAFILFPVALRWTKERTDLEYTPFMTRFLQTLAEWPSRYPKTILFFSLLATLASIWAGMRVKNNTDLIQFFKKNDPTYLAHAEVNRTLGSVRSLDLLLHRVDTQAFRPERDLASIASFIGKIDAIPGVVRTDSLLGQMPDPPDTANLLANRFVSDQGKTIRLQVQLGEMGSDQASGIVDRIQSFSKTKLGSDWIMEPTGDYYQMVRDSNQLVSTLLKSFALTLAIVMGSTVLLFRSFHVLVPAFIPNILPILWGAGLMGLMGIDLSTGTTMVAAVVIGLAVDDTIHYLHHLQSFRHLPIQAATRSTTLRIGHALTASTLVLVGGFWMGAFGSFIPTNTFALLTGYMMISALFCDLLVLPAYLNLTTKKVAHAK